MRTNNIITKTDSYKLNHWNQYPEGTEHVYSYFESRKGAKYAETVWFSLQGILKEYFVGQVVTRNGIEQAARLAKAHFGHDGAFNRVGWEYILAAHNGKLPLRIKSVPEGTPVPVGNVLMTVENTDPKCFWLTNGVESLLTHVWHGSNVATLSRETKKLFKTVLDITAESDACIAFMLHDFGYRGCSSDESASRGGAGHILNFMGTDTVPAIEYLVDFYGANEDYSNIAYSVPATEHSIMTSLGREGEPLIVARLLEKYPTGILSVVSDSYDYYNFVADIVGRQFKNEILARDGVFVVRPDSVTPEHPTPEALVAWTLKQLWTDFGGVVNKKGYKVLNPKIRVIWGDGIDYDGIEKILKRAMIEGFSAENLVFGMGGGLLQKHNRDTQRSAFKSSAQCRDGVWYDIFKDPKDKSKASKRGRLKLVRLDQSPLPPIFTTVAENDTWYSGHPDVLQTVFENGEMKREWTLEEMRANAAL